MQGIILGVVCAFLIALVLAFIVDRVTAWGKAPTPQVYSQLLAGALTASVAVVAAFYAWDSVQQQLRLQQKAINQVGADIVAKRIASLSEVQARLADVSAKPVYEMTSFRLTQRQDQIDPQEKIRQYRDVIGTIDKETDDIQRLLGAAVASDGTDEAVRGFILSAREIVTEASMALRAALPDENVQLQQRPPGAKTRQDIAKEIEERVRQAGWDTQRRFMIASRAVAEELAKLKERYRLLEAGGQ